MINHDSSFFPEMSVRVLHFQDDCSSHVSISSCTHFQMCFCNLQGSQSTEKAAIIIFGHSGIGEMVAHCAALMRSWSQWHFMSNESSLERHLGKAERGTWHLSTSSTPSSSPWHRGRFRVYRQGIILAVPQWSWLQTMFLKRKTKAAKV